MAYPIFSLGKLTYEFDFAGSFTMGNSVSISFNEETNKPFYKEDFILESDSDWCKIESSFHGAGAVESRGDTQVDHDSSCTTIIDGSTGAIRGYFGFKISCDYNSGEERIANLTIQHKDGWICEFKAIQHACKMLSNIEDLDEIIPGTTAWVEIPNKVIDNNLYPDDDNFVSNYGKADKIFYVYNTLPYNRPNINVYIPKSKVIESTNIKICYETNENISTDINERFCNIIDARAFDEMLPVTNWKDSSEHIDFKESVLILRDFRLYDRDTSSSILDVYGKMHIVVCDYGEIGKQFVIPFTFIKSTNESKQKFDEIAARYGSSNYDGTMQNLDWFNFPNTDAGYENCPCCGKPTYHKNNDFCDMCGYNKRKPKINYNEPYLTIGNNSANSRPVAEYQTGAFNGSGSGALGYINFGKYDYNASKVGTLVDIMNESLTIEYNLKWLNESTKNPVDINTIFKLNENNPKKFNELRYIHDDRYPDLDRWEAQLSYSQNYSNAILNGNDHVALKLTVKITSTLPDGSIKIYDETTCENRLDYTYVLYDSTVYNTAEKLKQLKQIYGYENLSPTTPVVPSNPSDTTVSGVIPGTTAWIEAPDRYYKWPVIDKYYNTDLNIPNYGRADKVIYLPKISPFGNLDLDLYIPKTYLNDNTNIMLNYDTNIESPTEEDLTKLISTNWLYDSKPIDWDDSDKYTDFKHKTVRISNFSTLTSRMPWTNQLDPAYFKVIFSICDCNTETGQFDLPFTIVVLRSGSPSRADLDAAVAKYGPSNYDGTMQNLDLFHFDKLDKNPYLAYCKHCHNFTYDMNARLCEFCDYSPTYKPKPGLPYFYAWGAYSSDYGQCKEYAYWDDGASGPEKIIFPDSLGITDYDSIKVTYDIVPIYPKDSNTDWINVYLRSSIDMPNDNDDYPYWYIPSLKIGEHNESDDYRAAKVVFTITADANGETITYKDKTLEYTFIQEGRFGGPRYDELKTIYGSEYHTDLYIKPDNMRPYPDESNPSTPEQLIVPEGKFTSDDLTISADGGTFWARFDITNMTYEYYNNLVSPRGKAHSAEVTWQNEKFFSDENEWVYGNLGAVNAHLKKDRTTGKPYLYVKYSVNPNTTNYKLTSYMMYRYWGTIKGAAQINADPLFECKIPVYQLPASDTITKTESLPDKPVGIAGETAVGAVECGYTNTLDVFAIAEEDIKTKLNVYSTAEWLKIKDITYNKN